MKTRQECFSFFKANSWAKVQILQIEGKQYMCLSTDKLNEFIEKYEKTEIINNKRNFFQKIISKLFKR